MKNIFPATSAEFIKIRHSGLVWATFVAFAIAPLMGGVFLLILGDPEAASRASSLAAKAQMMQFAANWKSYLGLLTQAVGVGGVMVFGFVASWLFGREYSDGTAKDLLSLPTSRARILNAKFVVYLVWCLALVASNLLVGLLVGTAVHLPAPTVNDFTSELPRYLITTALTVCLGTPIAFFALWGRGYLAPLGFLALTLVFAQVVAAAGYGVYFPWSIPGLYSGIGDDPAFRLGGASYGLLALTSLTGYFATVLYWKYSDHSK